MRVLVAMDSFKGSLTSQEAGEAVRQGILLADPDAQVQVHPLADGGEGTVEAICGEAHIHKVWVTGPLGQPVSARYGILPDTGVAVLEMAAAAGLTLVPPEKRDPMVTTTYGVGEMILDAIGHGCRRFIVGIGGSATNDGGTGMLTALGFRFLNQGGSPIPLGAAGLSELAAIDSTHVHPSLQECSFRIACDVTNPLCGEQGCSAVFSPQKGATSETIPRMDAWLSHYAQLTGGDPTVPGAGAAGGMGYGFLYYLNAKLESGVRIILSETAMEEKLQNADLVITGEGKLDGQSAMGKAPVGVAMLGKKHNKPVIAIAGSLGADAYACTDYGITRYYASTPEGMPLTQAMDPRIAFENVKNTARQVVACWQKAEETI